MATAELDIGTRAPLRRKRSLRYFFLGMAALAAIIVVTGFGPTVGRFAAGTFPIAWVLHVHAAMMTAWLGAFALQAYLGATGRIALHRQVGSYAVAVGWLACASLVFVEFRFFVTHPRLTSATDLDWTLPGPFYYLSFGFFLAWAVHERRRPQWHKRLMTFALFLSLGAAVQRFEWIPISYGFGPFALALDVLLLPPLITYDLRTLKGRLHPATVRGTLLLLSAQALVLALWGTSAWRSFASGVDHWVQF